MRIDESLRDDKGAGSAYTRIATLLQLHNDDMYVSNLVVCITIYSI